MDFNYITLIKSIFSNIFKKKDNKKHILKQNIKHIKKLIKGTIKKKDKHLLYKKYLYKIKYMYFLYILKPLEITPNAEELVNKSLDIIRNYENTQSFNKMEMYKILGKRWSSLNIYYYLFSKYFNQPTKLQNFIPDKYFKLTDFFIEQSILKSKNILYFFRNYFLSNKVFLNHITSIGTNVFVVILSFFVMIYMIYYMNFFFMTEMYGDFDWDIYFKGLSGVEQLIYKNTMFFGFFQNSSIGGNFDLTEQIIYKGFMNNILFWVGLIVIIILFIYITYYIISQFNLMKIFKYINERNTNIWFQVFLERIKIIEKVEIIDETTGEINSRQVIKYQNQDIYKLFTQNLNRVYKYKLINYQTRQHLFNMSIMNRKNQGKALNKDKFFSEGFRVFWLEIFNLVNKGSQGRFNLNYLEEQLKNRYATFSEIWEIEVKQKIEIINMILLFLSFVANVGMILFQYNEVDSIQKAIEIQNQKYQ